MPGNPATKAGSSRSLQQFVALQVSTDDYDYGPNRLKALAESATSPLRVLEKLLDRPLTQARYMSPFSL